MHPRPPASHPLPALTDLGPAERSRALESPDFHRLCVVRNPYARLVSAWADKIRQVKPGMAKVCRAIKEHAGSNDASSAPTFREFANWVVETNHPDRCDVHWRLQGKLLHPELIDYNVVLRAETLKRDLQELFDSIEATRGLDAAAQIAEHTQNVAIPIRWSQTYDAGFAARVTDFYAPTFETYGYDPDSWKELVARPDPDPATVEEAALGAIRARNTVIDAWANGPSASK